jgi:hypothetical protein
LPFSTLLLRLTALAISLLAATAVGLQLLLDSLCSGAALLALLALLTL